MREISMSNWHIAPFLHAHWQGFAVLAGLLSITLVLGFCVASLRRGRPLCWRVGDGGSASVEMVLVFPFFYLFLAVTIQMALLMQARLVVNYAAFMAARSASVWIPARLPDEPANSLRLRDQAPDKGGDAPALAKPQEKLDRIRGAAVMACAPISPSIQLWWRDYANSFTVFGRHMRPGLLDIANRGLKLADSVFNFGGPLLFLRLLPRWAYSSLFTQVTFNDNPTAETIDFSKGDIKVTVEHQFYVTVPFVGHLVGKSYTDLLEGWSFSLISANLFYVPVSESYTFRNEGEPLYPGY
jgi:hypothetical protein